jgi:hypothetical protein
MEDEKLLQPLPLKRHACLLIVCALATLCFSQLALAQSGRRQSKPASPSPPPVASEAKSESQATAPTPKSASPSVIVVGDRIGSSLYLPSTYVDMVVMACVERLREKPGLEIIQGGQTTRKAATDRAKKETSAYVLFIEIREESDGSSNLEIGYSVFTPGTAKVLTGGWVYPGNRGVGSGKVTVGVPTVARRLPLQYQLKDGGQQVADRVRGKIH